MMASVMICSHSQGWKPLSPISLAYLWMPRSSVSETWDSGMFLTISFSARSLSILISDKRDMLGVWVSEGCCDEVPQTGWLTTVKTFILSQFWGLEVWNEGINGVGFFGALRESLFHVPFSPSFRYWQASLGLPHLFDASLQSPLCACFSEFPLLGKPPVIEVGPTLI